MKQKLQLTKILLYTTIIIVSSTITYGQTVLQDFDGTPASINYFSQHTGLVTTPGLIATTIDNPDPNGTNTTVNKVSRQEKEANIFKAYDQVIVNTVASTEANGVYFYVDIYVPMSDGNFFFKAYPSNDGTGNAKQILQHYTGLTPNTWYTFEFDFTSQGSFAFESVGVICDFYEPGTTNSYLDNTSPAVTYVFDNFRQSSTVLSTSKYEIVKLGTYPNPTNGIINISDLSDINTINVYDLTGKTLKTFGTQSSIDISDLPAGVYILGADNGTRQKIVKK